MTCDDDDDDFLSADLELSAILAQACSWAIQSTQKVLSISLIQEPEEATAQREQTCVL